MWLIIYFSLFDLISHQEIFLLKHNSVILFRLDFYSGPLILRTSAFI